LKGEERMKQKNEEIPMERDGGREGEALARPPPDGG